MISKLPITLDFTEVAILFSDTNQALTFLETLVSSAKEQITEAHNEGWPESIYWNGPELHFYMDNYSWGTEPKCFYDEFQGEDGANILEIQTWYNGANQGTYKQPTQTFQEPLN